MPMRVLVLTSPASEYDDTVAELLEELRCLQSYFRFEHRRDRSIPNSVNRALKPKVLRDRIVKAYPKQPVLAITESYFAPDYLCFEYRNVSLITVNEWESRFAPPPLRIYLAFQIASSLLNCAANLSTDMIEEWSHETPVGCVFDWFHDGDELRRAMIAANLCGECEVKLAAMGIPDGALAAVEEILLLVRQATIRRPRTTPSRIFIGHGHSPNWECVRDYLVGDLGLSVVEFNQEATPGISTVDRLRSMLDEAAFAFLVMTADDKRSEGQRYARQNVIHEIGLFQGRLGFNKAIVLKQGKVEEFSNNAGLTYIQIPRKGLTLREKKLIGDVLRREGLLA